MDHSGVVKKIKIYFVTKKGSMSGHVSIKCKIPFKGISYTDRKRKIVKFIKQNLPKYNNCMLVWTCSGFDEFVFIKKQ